MPVRRTPQLKLIQRAFRYDAFPSDRFPTIDVRRTPTKKDTQTEATFVLKETGLGCRPGPVRFDYGIRFAAVQDLEESDFGEPRGYFMDVTMAIDPSTVPAGQQTPPRRRSLTPPGRRRVACACDPPRPTRRAR